MIMTQGGIPNTLKIFFFQLINVSLSQLRENEEYGRQVQQSSSQFPSDGTLTCYMLNFSPCYML